MRHDVRANMAIEPSNIAAEVPRDVESGLPKAGRCGVQEVLHGRRHCRKPKTNNSRDTATLARARVRMMILPQAPPSKQFTPEQA